MNSITQALKKKIGGAVDYLSGVRRIDNSADPFSALSMLRRKAATKAGPVQQAISGKTGKNSTGVGVGY